MFSFPYGGEEQYELSLRYGLDSPRLTATWMKDEASCIRQDLEFNGAEFIVLGETIIPRQDFCN